MPKMTSSLTLATAVAGVFAKMDSRGCAKLLLESELELTIIYANVDERPLKLARELEVHFPHDQKGNNGVRYQSGRIGRAPRDGRVPTRFTVSARDGAMLGVTDVADDGTMTVSSCRFGTGTPKPERQPVLLSNMGASSLY